MCETRSPSPLSSPSVPGSLAERGWWSHEHVSSVSLESHEDLLTSSWSWPGEETAFLTQEEAFWPKKC